MSTLFEPRRHPDTVVPTGSVRVADRPTARVAAKLLTQLDPITDEVVTTIRRQLPGYTGSEVTRDDLWWSVRANLDILMRIIAEDRSLRPDEVSSRATLGVRRARQQLAVTQLIQAFQIGYIEMWRMLTEAAKAEGQAAVDDLVDVAGHFWAMMHLVSAKVAEAYHETSREQGSEVRRRAQLFLDMIHGLPASTAAARDEAHALGLDPDGVMIAAVRRPAPEDDPLRARDAGIVLIERTDAVVMLTNCVDEAAAFAGERGPIGIGLPREGLEGALGTIRDARQAYDAARTLGRRVMRFRDDWFACVVSSQLDRLRPLVGDAVDVLQADDFTAETIQAYLDHRGHMAQTGEAVHVHANTVKYRLDRFAEKTGIDPRAGSDMVQLALAMLLTDSRG